jgi:putative drug exporter of the RND superfamily
VASLARWCLRRRRTVLVTWILALIVVAVISRAVGSSYTNNFSLPSTDSSRAEDIVQANFPSQSGDSDQIVVQAKTGTLADPATKATVTRMLEKVRDLPFVTTVTSPYDSRLISRDGTIGLATVQLNAQVQYISKSEATELINTAQAFRSHTLNVQLGGAAVEMAENIGGGSGFLAGVLLALLVLFFAFRRSVLSAILPLLSAVAAIGVGISLVGLLSHVLSTPDFATELAELISLGVGTDYALFIVNRHRRELLSGRTPEEAAVRAMDTSGRAVLLAGLTVCIALIGMFSLGLSFLYGVSLASALVVALTMLASLTLLPAMLGFYGYKALARRERGTLGAVASGSNGARRAAVSGFWPRWSEIIASRSGALSVAAFAVIVVVALPFFSMRLGLADSGEDPSSSTSRQAYDLLAQAFGPGFNGPLQVVGQVNGPADVQRYDHFIASLHGQRGIASIQPTRTSPNGKAVVTIVYPAYTPQAVQTTELVNRIRSEVPAATAGSSLAIHVGGQTAGGIDFSRVLIDKMPLFVTVIVILSFLLLAIVFRSLLIPLTASVMNLLSIGAALGAMTAAFQFGWGKSVLGFARAGPIEVYLPVMVFAVLFGLSMDYEVFLVSRMHEEWVLTRDNRRAVIRGQSETGRVITAAALIMILVFLSFSLLGNSLVIQEFSIGFAAAIVIDAFVVRTVLVPALMHLFGNANWWLPRWMDRRIPRFHLEGEDVAFPELPREPVSAGVR